MRFLCTWKSHWRSKESFDFPSMWKLKESMLGNDDDEGSREGLLDEESDGFFSLSPMQVLFEYIYIYIYEFTQFLISSTWVFVNFRFYKTILVLGFDFAENLCFCRVFCRWSSLYDTGTSICSLFFIYLLFF